MQEAGLNASRLVGLYRRNASASEGRRTSAGTRVFSVRCRGVPGSNVYQMKGMGTGRTRDQ